MKLQDSHRRKPGKGVHADELAKELHDRLGQHLVGVTLETGALARKLDDRHAPELPDVQKIVEHLRLATAEVSRLIDWLDRGRPR